MISSVMIAVFASLLALAITWQEYYDYAFEAFLSDNDPDDWAGREADYCIAQDEYACQYADDCTEDDDDDWDDDDDCDCDSITQAADGAYYSDDCGALVMDIADDEFAGQHGGNFSPGAFKGW